MSQTTTITSMRQQIRSAILAAIQAANTAAGTRVFGPRDLPTDPKIMPCVIVSSPPRERSESLVKGQPSFETTGLFPVTVRVAGQTIEAIDAQLETLIVQIKTSVFSYMPLLDLIERVTFMETSTELLSEGTNQIGQANIIFACEFPDFYYPAPGVPITEFQATITNQATGAQLGSFDLKFQESS
ncbi:MAG TPA: hypothetical protein VFG62_08750 [Rhodopila sp.]|nr:hypothetical protein [Rhodopila sp.]